MKATSVICRFLSLLDVAFILIGFFLLMLTQVQLRASHANKRDAGAGASNGIAAVDFLYLYAGTYGEERGKCYLVGQDRKIAREIRMDNADDVKSLTKARQDQERANQVIMLLISDKGFDSMWGSEKLAQLEKTWGLKVVPIYNFTLSH